METLVSVVNTVGPICSIVNFFIIAGLLYAIATGRFRHDD